MRWPRTRWPRTGLPEATSLERRGLARGQSIAACTRLGIRHVHVLTIDANDAAPNSDVPGSPPELSPALAPAFALDPTRPGTEFLLYRRSLRHSPQARIRSVPKPRRSSPRHSPRTRIRIGARPRNRPGSEFRTNPNSLRSLPRHSPRIQIHAGARPGIGPGVKFSRFGIEAGVAPRC